MSKNDDCPAAVLTIYSNRTRLVGQGAVTLGRAFLRPRAPISRGERTGQDQRDCCRRTPCQDPNCGQSFSTKKIAAAHYRGNIWVDCLQANSDSNATIQGVIRDFYHMTCKTTIRSNAQVKIFGSCAHVPIAARN